ncbi:hypothetical protein OH76DRAFT_806127 [Lentinus brumalis]|uniref:F-box domain-containing protein n=1 Tax=Lentinus brumalis TaxID=2498619 RepID=A0A371D2X5_9APHY|nr:hypothetical protein OH76DRAFT_806127 [Polyporus brumalis]
MQAAAQNMTSHRAVEAFQSFSFALDHDLQSLPYDSLRVLEEGLRSASVFVRRRLNETSPLNRLPAEIVTSMLLYVRDLHKRPSDYDPRHVEPEPDIRSLLTATHLCHRLRAIAVGSPSLWSIIPHSYPQEFDLLLAERSGDQPLRAFGDRSGRFRWATTSPIFRVPHRARIQELCLAQMPDEAPCNEMLLAAVASHLVYLNVLVTTKNPRSVRVPIPRYYFGGKAPKGLRALSLSLRAGVSPVDYFASLVHIRLCGSDVVYKGRDFLRLLANTPVVESLYLVDAPFELGHDWARPDLIPIAHLDRLRVLSFDNPGFEAAFTILERIKFPPDAIVQLHRLHYIPKKTNLGAMFVPSMQEFTSLEVIERWPAVHIRARGENGGGVWVHVVSKVSVSMLDLRAIIPTLLDKFSGRLNIARTLRVGGTMSSFRTEHNLLKLVMPKASQLMPTLSTLVVGSDGGSPTGDIIPSIKRALLPSEAFPTVPCPVLDELAILGRLITAKDEHLLELLAERGRLGSRIRKLNIRLPREKENIGVLGSSGLADHVEETDTRRITWNPEMDKFWRFENEYWKLYPETTQQQMYDLWGLPELWRE